MGSVSRRRSLISEASNASVTYHSSQVAQTVFPVRPRLLFNDGNCRQQEDLKNARLVPCVAIYTNSRGNTIPQSSNKGSGRNGDQRLVRNGDEITSHSCISASGCLCLGRSCHQGADQEHHDRERQEHSRPYAEWRRQHCLWSPGVIGIFSICFASSFRG